MASGINKTHQPGTCNVSKAACSSSAEECSQEMHMKMCKKIAQLTKVIYALNAKNDEHEATIQALREAHEEEIQHILAETRETILQCKSKVEEEQLLRKHIQALETEVEQHKRLKEEALAELMLCKMQVEEREPRTEIKQAQTVLSVDTVGTNADFENKLLHLYQESDRLVNECKASRRENIDEKVILDEKYSVEGQPLINETKNLKSENQREGEEYTQKTSNLQASRGKEKETLKKAMQQSMIETKNCQQREMEQRKSSEAEKGFLLQQVKKLAADLEEKNQKINERKRHSQKLKERIQVGYKTMIFISFYKSANYQFLKIWGRRRSFKHVESNKLPCKGKLQSHKEKICLKEFLSKGLEDLVMKHAKEIKKKCRKKSECELNQLEKEKEALDGKLQNSSLEKRQEARDIKILQEAWQNKKCDLEVAQLKQILDQQASNFKESLKKHSLQSNKEKEKLLQDLQNVIKENQNVKLQLEASHQKVLNMLEKSKNQELKAEERLKKEFNETFKSQHQSHRLEIQTLEEKAKKELHDELEQIQKQQTVLLGSLRMELSEQQTLCTNLRKQIEELQMELRSVRTLKKQQARIQFLLHCHVVFCESSSIKFLSSEITNCTESFTEIELFSFPYVPLQNCLPAFPYGQTYFNTNKRLLIEDLNIKHKKELDILKQDHRKEIENILSDFSSAQAHLQAKIFSLETEKCQHSHLANNESYRNRSFSFNPNTGCSTPSMKKKKTIEAPSRVVSVPNLASYAKSFLSCDLRSKRSAPQITKSTSLDRSPGCLRVGFPSAQSSESSAATRYLSILQ
uniref:Protein FAM184A/B N-terminal domain-containing protein n=1 Tax=Melopsittacus undulatus TaxID=13146 RepID=A0A8C6K2H1_MELUD